MKNTLPLYEYKGRDAYLKMLGEAERRRDGKSRGIPSIEPANVIAFLLQSPCIFYLSSAFHHSIHLLDAVRCSRHWTMYLIQSPLDVLLRMSTPISPVPTSYLLSVRHVGVL